MPILTAQQITEVNILIAEIEKSIIPTSEIGARDKSSLKALLKTNKITKTPQFFRCRREYSDIVVSHFVKEKSLLKNRFHVNKQTFIFLLK